MKQYSRFRICEQRRIVSELDALKRLQAETAPHHDLRIFNQNQCMIKQLLLTLIFLSTINLSCSVQPTSSPAVVPISVTSTSSTSPLTPQQLGPATNTPLASPPLQQSQPNCQNILSKMSIDSWILLISALGEIAIAVVIWIEWEGSRLDKFLEDSGERNKKRSEIYSEYCGLSCPENMQRNQMFKKILGSKGKSDLRELCDENIRLFSRVGARLPRLPHLRNRVLDWHVVVFLWEILGPYVEERRRAAGPSYAKPFLEYAFASVEHLLEQKRNEWVIVDPDMARKNNVTLTRDHLTQMKVELKKSLKQ
ncbi:MAG: hypothetical protein ABSH11_09630 [Verrucomicrobiota bacterium]|jgi:hypothetical protein